MKEDIIKTLEKRAEHFDSIHHSYESREIWSAIDVIERLIPPELFSIPVVSDFVIQEIERRRAIIISEPDGIVREQMINNIALEL